MTEKRIQRLAAALVSRPWIYDLVQILAGQRLAASRLRTVVERLPHERVLDVGSAAGGFALRLGVQPTCLDLDPVPLRALRDRMPSAVCVAADAARMPFADRAFDLTLCVAVSHHLDDETLPLVISELSRVTLGNLLFLDAVRNERRAVSRWLWRHDRGRNPRTPDELRTALERRFRLSSERRFTLYHQYVLWVGSPR
jgi:SAM-dependent methyltransferase